MYGTQAADSEDGMIDGFGGKLTLNDKCGDFDNCSDQHLMQVSDDT